MIYQVLQIADPGASGAAAALGRARDVLLPGWQARGVAVWGHFQGLFGLADNEMQVVLMGAEALPDVADDCSAHGFVLQDEVLLLPTVRPVRHEPRSRPGLYVFRWFEVAAGQADEAARLSADAWQTFEADFDTEVQGLFRQARPAAEGQPERMLLCTWYRNFAVWEDSRQPSDAARANFVARRQLMRRAYPQALRLFG